MEVSALASLPAAYQQDVAIRNGEVSVSGDDFNSVFQSAVNMLGETNQLQNNAEAAEIQFALGKAENTHDLQVAQEKANIALQYTVAVRDKLLDAYKEIMNMQM